MKARKGLESLRLLRRRHCASFSTLALTTFFPPTKRANSGEAIPLKRAAKSKTACGVVTDGFAPKFVYQNALQGGRSSQKRSHGTDGTFGCASGTMAIGLPARTTHTLLWRAVHFSGIGSAKTKMITGKEGLNMALKDRVKQLEFDVERLRKNSIVMTYDFGPVDLRWCAHELASHLKKDAEPASQAGAKATPIPEGGGHK